ncbi:putative tRNA pseudouridine synthase [Selaginella moellendorffii]|uniref:putative tRNA pseudouridine synthase n=1 Tax=Selaginella moellendorffii TaxID=88036 RepID=UPI000D1CDF7D|nr:putative tRNA pseudouridine synthase [Selaginella moellendorffii]|eukprot:XP_024532959.1 putative tRNA pseudouridine synthase [Selaginella moellendorffii]
MVPICVLGGRGAESGAAVCKLAAVDEVLRFKKNVAIWVGYVGTDYKGLQIQRGVAGIHSVENELEEAIYKAGGISEENYRHLDKVRWKRSSRTDKGVHSLCTVVTMKLEVAVNSWLNDVDGIKIADAFNAYLPANISIFGVVPVTKSFDARRSCYSRTYDYYFPAACIGINNESSSEDVDQRIQDFRRTLKSLEARVSQLHCQAPLQKIPEARDIFSV